MRRLILPILAASVSSVDHMIRMKALPILSEAGDGGEPEHTRRYEVPHLPMLAAFHVNDFVEKAYVLSEMSFH